MIVLTCAKKSRMNIDLRFRQAYNISILKKQEEIVKISSFSKSNLLGDRCDIPSLA